MNFIEAALLLLKKSRRSLSVEQLVEQAENEDLLDKPGKDPQRSMKAALSRELKGGDDSRVVQVGDDRYRLAKGAAKEVEAAKPAKKTGPAATKAAKATTAKTTAAKATTKTPAKKAVAEKAITKKATAKKTTAKKTTIEAVRDTTGARKTKKPAKAKEPAVAPVEAEELAALDTVIEPEALEGRVDYNILDSEAGPETSTEAAVEPAAEIPVRKTGRNRRSRRGRRGAGQAAAVVPVAEDDQVIAEAPAIELVPEEISAEVAEVLAPRELPVRAEPAEAPAEEQELEAIYGDELSGTEPGAAFAEYRDAQTEDEDRPMMPEIVSTRHDRQKRERRRRRRDRDRYRGGEGREGEPRAAEPRTAEPRAAEPRAVESRVAESRVAEPRAAEPRAREVQLELELPAIAAGPGWSRPGNAIGQGAAEVLRAGNGSQPTRAKQIALMMRKRQLLTGDPEKLWPHVKAALISDEQDRLARGMRPLVVHRGRDQFALAEGPADPLLADAEDAVERATAAMAAATHAAVQARLGALDLSALERVVYVLLVRQGWQQIEWIKRVQRSAYAVAQAPDGLGTMLVGVRAGDQPVDRRGVGELRVGIQAKKLPGGLLVAPQPLSEVGRQELRRNGPSISLLVGDALVSMLIQNGIGVRTAQVPVSLVDETFFREVAID